ncbi:hypothetical protein L249_8581 [Ophiocordyceps polyrhachis-furcata BCC 54312]|uniref:CENP-V/GFA domain-containing protein n=1 Tax=Ophiocordyceps polyrhachis-furcata BCC 54312 TaxID=1330021 RepID=A0A367L734_9HYPO|nr:hypothetical protein L249_8581 [Ophiocordyceps polyrhachis-furcata BCC 54312]
MTALCHCTDCQKWTGGAFTSNIIVQRDVFQVTKGKVKVWDVVPNVNNGHANRRFFCPNCGSGLYTELDLLPDYTCINAGSLHGRAAGLDGEVDFELYAKSRVDYLRPCSGARQEAFFDLESPAIVDLQMRTSKIKKEEEEKGQVMDFEIDTDTEIAYGFTPEQAADMDLWWDSDLKPEIRRETILGC